MKLSETRRVAVAVFVVTFAVYIFPFVYDLAYKPFFTWTAAQDIASTSLLPIALLEHGDFALDQFREFYKTFDNTYFVAEVNGRLVSRSPVAAAVLAVPFYGVPLASGWIAHPPNAWLTYPWTGYFVAKFAAALITALAVLMLFFCARELADTRTSAALALVFAFGTSAWSTASQALWQQTPSLLFQLIGIWFLLRGRRKGAYAVAPAAFFFSAATISRPNNAIPALLFTLYVVVEYRRAFLRWIAWSIPPVLFFLGYNATYNGSPFVIGYQDGVLQYTTVPQLEAILGLLFSPSRGLFVYSPFFILAVLGVWQARIEKERFFYLLAGLTAGFEVFLLSTFKVWDGGWGYGTRMLTDTLPYLTLLLVPVLVYLRGVARFAFWVSLVYAVLLQSFGLWDYGVRWHWHWNNLAYNVWDIAENEPLFYFKQYVAMTKHFLTR